MFGAGGNWFLSLKKVIIPATPDIDVSVSLHRELCSDLECCTLHYVFYIILQFVSRNGSVQYAQYDVISVLEYIVFVDNAKGVGSVLANRYYNSVISVLRSD